MVRYGEIDEMELVRFMPQQIIYNTRLSNIGVSGVSHAQPQITSKQFYSTRGIASRVDLPISLGYFTFASLDTAFPIRATPALLHRFLGQTNGRLVIALLFPNDGQLPETVMRRCYAPTLTSPEPHHL